MDVLLDKMNPYPQKNSVLVLDNAKHTILKTSEKWLKDGKSSITVMLYD